jgi:hypothetical protein
MDYIKSLLPEWEKLPVSSFELILIECKESLKSQIDEVISVTEKTTKYALGFLSFFFAVSVLVFIKRDISCSHLLILALSSYIIYLAHNIITKRSGHEQGLLPENIITNDFNSIDFTDDDKIRLSYLNAIEAYNIKIKEIIIDNKLRAGSVT